MHLIRVDDYVDMIDDKERLKKLLKGIIYDLTNRGINVEYEREVNCSRLGDEIPFCDPEHLELDFSGYDKLVIHDYKILNGQYGKDFHVWY